MKKKILSILFLLLCLTSASAQDLVQFKLTRSGSFVDIDNKGFVVVPFAGKTASELYNMVKNNILSIYKDPKQVMSENEGQTIAIRAKGGLVWKTIAFIPRTFEGYYTMVFRFKDGRIRVDAPVVEDNLTDSDGWLNKTLSFTSYCHSHIAKNGKPATKFDVKKVSQTENAMNVIINQILGLIKTTPTITTDDNW